MESLESRVAKLDEYQVAEAFLLLVRELSDDPAAGRGFDPASLKEAEAEATRAVAEAFPVLSATLDTAHRVSDPWTQADLYRAFLLTYIAEAPDSTYLRPVERALDGAESARVQPAGLPPVLIGVAIVMLLQIDFEIRYEVIDGKKTLKFGMSKKPTSETVIGKLLEMLPG